MLDTQSAITAQAQNVRPVFATSRSLEYCSIKELTAQTGHGPEDWPVVIIKELMDNALDACEEHGVAPKITIGIEENSLTVANEGPGLPHEIIPKIIDYSVRASSREAFVAPTRGAQGNALKTIIAMPYAIDGTSGTTTIESHGKAHKITFKADQIRQEPVISVDTERSFVKNGTRVTVHWPETPRFEIERCESRILQIALTYIAINPHLTLQITLDGAPFKPTNASISKWSRWRSSDPVPAHWYEPDTFERLIAAHVRDDQDRGRNTLVREFVKQFRGLSGSAKQKTVLETVGASRMTLAEFFGSGDAINKDETTALLKAMKNASKPAKAGDLGIIGEEHLQRHLLQLGAHPETIRYKRFLGDSETSPFVIEAAFGCVDDDDADRQLAIGLNFSPAIRNPIRELSDYLEDAWVSDDDTVIVALHITCPRFAFTDRGKGSIVLPFNMRHSLAEAIRLVCKEWTKQRRAEEREASARARRMERLSKRRKISKKRCSIQIMEHAYLKASANGSLPATATQVMYAARNYIQEVTGKRLNRQDFNQRLLPEFMEENPELTANWDILYDDRGHFFDPHTGEVISLGTKAVRRYLNSVVEPEFCPPNLQSANVTTRGPHGGYGALLYIEKEGFLDILNAVQIAQRYDIGIMSCKGTSVTAARRLADTLCHIYNIPLFVLHDFDKAGVTILGTLRSNTRRYKFQNDIKVVDLGLRIEDVDRLGLHGLAENVFDKGKAEKRAANMRKNGASEEEIRFLLQRRVELNALLSEQFVAFVEDKLIAHGVRKVVPQLDELEQAYRLFKHGQNVESVVKATLESIGSADIAIPADLQMWVQQHLEQHPSCRWDDAVAHIATSI